MESQEVDALEVESSPLRVLVPSPLGNLGMEVRGRVVTGLVFAPKGKAREFYTPFADLDESEALDEILGHLSEYFAGARKHLDIDYDLDASGISGFPRRILKETAKIPYGRTRTYQQVAEAAGRPDAYRLVLSVLLSNPIPIFIPCHRVVTLKAGPGSYIGGKKRKQWLLRLEKEGLRSGSTLG